MARKTLIYLRSPSFTMAYMRICTLVVLTLLQLCRAEISNTPESWYSANVISDGFHPKPISELFSTESTFSSTNPIIVLPNSTIQLEAFESMSTLHPSTPELSITSTSGTIPQMSTTPSPTPTQTTTLSPLHIHSETPSSLQPQTSTVTVPPPTSTIQIVSQTPSTLSTQSTVLPREPYQEVLPLSPSAPQYDRSIPQFQSGQFDSVSNPEPPFGISQPSLESLFQTIPQRSLIPEMTIHLNNQPELVIVQDLPNSDESTTPQTIIPSEITTPASTFTTASSLPTQSTIFSSSFSSEPTLSPLREKIDQSVISERPLQQTQQSLQPQTIQGPPPLAPSNSGQWQQIRFEVVPQPPQPPSIQPSQTGFTGQPTPSPGLTPQPLTNYFMIYQQAPQSFDSSLSRPLVTPSVPQQLPAALPSQSSTLTPPTSLFTLTTLPARPSTFLPSTTLPPITTIITQVPPQTTRPPVSTHQPVTSMSPPTVSSANPCSLTALKPGNNLSPVQSIPIIPMRIRVVSPSGSRTNIQIRPQVMPTTTRTTTRSPTTRRTRKPKPKKNTYDYCVNSCKAPRNPICATPLSSRTIDPETLKGFPSICHMACHNSYRIHPFEKIADGRCGRLRTRIRPLDSSTKLKKDELVKTQYFVDQTGQKAVIEFSSGVA